MIVFAHISDIHLDGSAHRADRLAAVVAYLNGLSAPLDAVLVTGDIADHGRPGEYQQAREILSASPHPVFSCPGNHDARAAYRTVLLGEGGGPDGGGTGGGTGQDHGAPVNRVHRTAGALFAMCDSTIPGRPDGNLADETLTWLDAVLGERPDLPAFVCFHHPPVVLHSPYVDEIRQFGEHRLAGLIARHPQVVAIACGHAHTPAATTFAGRPLLVAPGVASTIVLPWERGDLVDERAPAGIAFHVLDDNQRLTSHYRAITGIS